ncbi:MAG: universal stress protein [Sterolibacterium sp.]|jgi:nucleotide-binding universal stress UspA family protein
MSLKNLMVHLDSGERTQVRLDIAVAIARQHQARLLGVFGQRAEPEKVGIVATWPSDAYVAAARASKAQFEAATANLGQVEWHDVNRGSDAELLRQITSISRYSDLIIMGQHDEDANSYVPSELAEEVILNSGRPVLLIPYIGQFAAGFERPLIAWNNSREAAHAVSDALPLIENCQEVTVVSLDTQHDAAAAACTELARHLACHGIKSKTDILMVNDIGIMDMLLNRLTDRDADLLVMGAHGQIGFPFVSRGAGTRHILRHMTVPVLMAN